MGGGFLQRSIFSSLFFLAIFNSGKVYAEGEVSRNETDATCEASLAAPKIEDAIKRSQDFFAALKGRLLERDEIVDLVELALLAKEHVLLVGPPGNAKSMVVDLLGKNLIEASGSTSYYKIQLTPETTQNEIIGPLSPKDLLHNDKYTRLVDEGVLAAKIAFFDEIFDGNPKTLRDILGVLNERAHAQALRIHAGRLETAIAASNKYPSQVYEKAAQLHDEDGPKAVFDRIGLVIYVTPDFFDQRSDNSLIQGKFAKVKIPQLQFSDLDAIRSKVGDVEIPEHVASFMSLLSHRLKQHLSSLEEKSLLEFKRAQQSGEIGIDPPYRSTKYHSKRTLAKAATFLRSLVVQDWIKKGGHRPLVATLEDLKKLEVFFCLNGASLAQLDELMQLTTNRHEKVQLLTIRIEKEAFQSIYADLLKDLNGEVYQTALSEIQVAVSSLKTDEEKSAYAKKLIEKLISYDESGASVTPWNNTGERIGRSMLKNYIETTLKDLLGAEEYQKNVETLLLQLKEEKERLIAEEKKRVEEERLKELEEARKQELEAARIQSLAIAKQAELTQFYNLLASPTKRPEPIYSYMNTVTNSDLVKLTTNIVRGRGKESKVFFAMDASRGVITKFDTSKGIERKKFTVPLMIPDLGANLPIRLFVISDDNIIRLTLIDSNQIGVEFINLKDANNIVSTIEYIPVTSEAALGAAFVSEGKLYLPSQLGIWKQFSSENGEVIQRSLKVDRSFDEINPNYAEMRNYLNLNGASIMIETQTLAKVVDGKIEYESLNLETTSGYNCAVVSSLNSIYRICSNSGGEILLQTYRQDPESGQIFTESKILEIEPSMQQALVSYFERQDLLRFNIFNDSDLVISYYANSNSQSNYNRSVYDIKSGKLYKTSSITQNEFSQTPIALIDNGDEIVWSQEKRDSSYQSHLTPIHELKK